MSLTRALDVANNKANLVYNKVLGYPYTTDNLISEYPASAVSLIPKNVIMAQDIPQEAPALTDALKIPITISHKKFTTDSPIDVTFYKNSNSSAPYLTKYIDVPLISIESSLGRAFYYKSWNNIDNVYSADASNILTQAIATNYGGKGTYTIEVKTSTGNYIEPFHYFFDRDAGVISFFGYNSVSTSNPPKVSFWRYEGTFGTINQNTDAVFGKNSDGSAYYNEGSVAIGKRVAGSLNGVQYKLDVSGNLNVAGDIMQNGVPITGVLDSQYEFNTEQNAPRIDNRGDYAVNDGNGNKRDDYSSAIHKIDNWLSTYMLSQPPEIDVTDASGIKDGNDLIFIWDHNPQQYQFGFMSRKLPATGLIHAAIDVSGTNTSYSFSADIFNDTIRNIAAFPGGGEPHRERYVPDLEPITALILSKNSGPTGREQRNITLPSGVTKQVYAYVYYNTVGFSTIMEDIFVQVWYSNSSAIEPNKMRKFSLGQFLSMSPPSEITFVSNPITNITNTGAIISWLPPQYVANNPGAPLTLTDVSNPGYPLTDKYKIEYVATATEAYTMSGPTAYNVTPVYPDTETWTESNLHAGTTYEVTINTKNNSSGYSAFTTTKTTLTTTKPAPPKTLAEAEAEERAARRPLRFTSYNNNTTDKFRSITGAITNMEFETESLVKAGAIDILSNTIPNVAVVHTANIGGMRGTEISNGTSTDTLTGFDTKLYVADITNPIINSTVVNIQDAHTDSKLQNLFLKSDIQFKLDAPSGVTSQPVTYTQTFINGTGDPVGNSNQIQKTIYIDTSDPAIPATITGVTIDSVNTTYTPMCGLNVLTNESAPNVILKDLLINNIGKKFVNETRICSVDDCLVNGNTDPNITTTPTNITFQGQKGAKDTTDDSDVTDIDGNVPVSLTSLPDNLKVCVNPANYVTVSMVIGANKEYVQRIPLKLTPYNLKGAAPPYTSKSVPIVIDKSVKAYLAGEHLSEQYPYNVFKATVRKHVDTAPSGSSLGLITDYDQLQNLASPAYSTELLYANNAFRYHAGSSTYLINYGAAGIYGNTNIDYSPIAAETGKYRYAVFKWKLDKQNSNTPISKMQIELSNLSSANLTYNNGTNNVNVNGQEPVIGSVLNDTDMQLFYRIVDYDVTGNTAQNPSSSNLSTYWINALRVGSTGFKQNAATSSNNLILGGLLSTAGPNIPNNIFDVTITPFDLKDNVLNKIDIYVLVAIRSVAQITFTDVKTKVYNI